MAFSVALNNLFIFVFDSDS